MRIAVVTFGLAVLCGSVALAQQPAPAAAQKAAPPRARGYLTAETAPQGALILPPAPVDGTDRFAQDRAVFRASRALEGSDRWKLAQADNELTTADMMRNFSCAVGTTLNEATAPKTFNLLRRAAVDSGLVSNTAKDVFNRQRPFHFDQGNICIPHTERFDASLDYPSGHTTLGWTLGLILAEIAPERSTPILTRARAYGESRVVCGVHNASAIEGGRTAGSITVSAMHGSPEFRADLDAARAEIASLRAQGSGGLDAGMCVKEAELIARTPYPY